MLRPRTAKGNIFVVGRDSCASRFGCSTRLCPWMLHPSGYMMETVNPMLLLTSQSDKEFIDIVETIYRGARKGRGLVMSPKDSLACLGLHVDVGGSEGSNPLPWRTENLLQLMGLLTTGWGWFVSRSQPLLRKFCSVQNGDHGGSGQDYCTKYRY